MLLRAREPPLQEHDLINVWEHTLACGQFSRLVCKVLPEMRASWVPGAALALVKPLRCLCPKGDVCSAKGRVLKMMLSLGNPKSQGAGFLLIRKEKMLC